MTSGRPILERWFQMVWAEESDRAIEEMFQPEGSATGLGDDNLEGPAAFKSFRDAMLGLISDVKIVINDHFDNAEMNAAICTLTAKNKKTGADVRMDGCCYYKTADGHITRADNYWNFIELFEQLGCLPQGTFGTALCGGAFNR